jgi:hypothetical protein
MSDSCSEISGTTTHNDARAPKKSVVCGDAQPRAILQLPGRRAVLFRSSVDLEEKKKKNKGFVLAMQH